MSATAYTKFFLMLVISLVIMYTVMFFNVDDIEHVYLSLTRLYMSVLMVSPMAILMVVMMKNMYTDKKRNRTIILTSVLLFAVSFLLLRTQVPVGDRQYMKAMIPHHSSAIMTSKHANLTDPEVKRLSESIIASQRREIDEMKQMLKRLR